MKNKNLIVCYGPSMCLAGSPYMNEGPLETDKQILVTSLFHHDVNHRKENKHTLFIGMLVNFRILNCIRKKK